MLVNLTKFWNNKSIKLSDSFDVLLTVGEKEKRLINCTGFTIPKLEYEEETYEYGNVAQVFQKPKYDSCKEMTLEFTETMVGTNYSYMLSRIFDEMGYKLSQTYSTGLMTNTAKYEIDKKINQLEIKIMNNKIWRYIFKYHFDNLKIVNYTTYNLDYQSDSPCKVTVTLAFETFYKEVINEPIWDEEQKQVEKPQPKETPKEERKEKQDPNGKVNYDSVSIDGQNYSKKEDIEMNWKNAANQDDLHTMDNEPLLNPIFGELPDLDDEDTPPEIQTEMYKQSINDDDLASLRERPELAELKELDLDDDEPVSNPQIENQVASNGQMSGGYKQPAIGSNGSNSGESAANASQKATQKAELANKQEKKEEKQVASGEKTYGGLTASELGKRAAHGDKDNPNGIYRDAALNAVGLDAKARKEVEDAYNAEMNRKS